MAVIFSTVCSKDVKTFSCVESQNNKTILSLAILHAVVITNLKNGSLRQKKLSLDLIKKTKIWLERCEAC